MMPMDNVGAFIKEVIKLYKDYEKREQLGISGYNHAHQYLTFERMYKEYLNLYTNALAGKI